MHDLLDILRTGNVPKFETSLCYRIENPPEFNDSIWFFGCSHVYGYGLPRDQTAPYVLEKLTGIKTLNLGIPKSGVDFMLENLTRLLEKYKPKAIVTAYADMCRKMFIVNGKPVFFTSMHTENNVTPAYQSDRSSYAKEFLCYINLIKKDMIIAENVEIIKSIRKIASHRNIPHIEFSYVPDNRNTLTNIRQFDRTQDWLDMTDNWHPGPLTQELVANWVYDQLKLKNIHV